MPDLHVSFPNPCDAAWEAMTPSGCDRVCARCDHVVHDLAEYTIDQAEALLRARPGSCVRAQIGADGTVVLKPGRGGKARRMVVAAAAAVAVMTAATPALARQGRPTGAIAGRVAFCAFDMRVVATSADGHTFRGGLRYDGRFRIKHLPAGTYRLSFESRRRGGDGYVFENVVVRDGETSQPNLDNGEQCVVVGLLTIEDTRA